VNSDLKDRVYDIPEEVIQKINQTLASAPGNDVHGIKRAKTLCSERKVTYGQLKRIIHDIKTLDKNAEQARYNLYGGELMEKWSEQHLKGERDLVSNRKDSRKNADEMSSITGERKNSHLKKHTKKDNFKIPTNLIKSNSHKSSISPITSLGLFEEIERMKKLML
jgi:hypothetical protein